MIIDPRGLSVIEWTDYMVDELTGYSQPPRLDDPEDWQAWALVVSQAPAIAAFNPPNPMSFAHWQDWAERFNQTVDLQT